MQKMDTSFAGYIYPQQQPGVGQGIYQWPVLQKKMKAQTQTRKVKSTDSQKPKRIASKRQTKPVGYPGTAAGFSMEQQHRQVPWAQPQQVLWEQPHQVLWALPQQVPWEQQQQVYWQQPQQISWTQPQQITWAQPQQVLWQQPQQVPWEQQQQAPWEYWF